MVGPGGCVIVFADCPGRGSRPSQGLMRLAASRTMGRMVVLDMAPTLGQHVDRLCGAGPGRDYLADDRHSRSAADATKTMTQAAQAP